MWKWIKWKLKIGWYASSIHVKSDGLGSGMFGYKTVEWVNDAGEKRVVVEYGFLPYM